jgi:hypothetical protein
MTFFQDQRWLTIREDAADDPLIIVRRFSHLIFLRASRYFVLLRNLVEMAGNFGCLIGSMQLSKQVVFWWGILGFDRPFHPPIFQSSSLSDRHNHPSVPATLDIKTSNGKC